MWSGKIYCMLIFGSIRKEKYTNIRLMIDLIYCAECHFQQYFSYIMATSFSGGRSRSTRREPPTMGK